MTVTNDLPPELSQASGDIQLVGSTHIVSMNYSGGTATWTFVDPLPAGSTGAIRLEVRFPQGSTPDGTTATNIAQIDASNATPVNSNPVTVTADATSKASTKKEVLASVVDGDSIYRVSVCNNEKDGNLNLSDVQMVDTLPAGAIFVRASDGGVYNPGANTVTWNLPDRDVGGCHSRTVTVRYTSANGFSAGQPVSNGLEVTATPLGESPVTLTTTNTTTLELPAPNASLTKGHFPDPALPDASLGDGGTFRFDFNMQNTGNVPLQSYVFTDTIPAQVEVLGIRTAGHNQPAGDVTTIVAYQTNLDTTWTTVSGYDQTANSAQYVAVSSLGLTAGEYVTALRWSYPTLPVEFDDENSGHKRNGFDIRQTARRGAFSTRLLPRAPFPRYSFPYVSHVL